VNVARKLRGKLTVLTVVISASAQICAVPLSRFAADGSPAPKTLRASTQIAATPSASDPKHTSPKKKVVHEGGTAEPTAQLAPGMTQQQAAQQRQATDDLLAAAETNLHKLTGRPLDQNQQATVDQVKDFMKQARAANEASDFTRARNLAFKAQLLSDDLVQH
jgi:hypothetical protein